MILIVLKHVPNCLIVRKSRAHQQNQVGKECLPCKAWESQRRAHRKVGGPFFFPIGGDELPWWLRIATFRGECPLAREPSRDVLGKFQVVHFLEK